jgi:hypothetical protein
VPRTSGAGCCVPALQSFLARGSRQSRSICPPWLLAFAAHLGLLGLPLLVLVLASPRPGGEARSKRSASLGGRLVVLSSIVCVCVCAAILAPATATAWRRVLVLLCCCALCCVRPCCLGARCAARSYTCALGCLVLLGLGPWLSLLLSTHLSFVKLTTRHCLSWRPRVVYSVGRVPRCAAVLVCVVCGVWASVQCAVCGRVACCVVARVWPGWPRAKSHSIYTVGGKRAPLLCSNGMVWAPAPVSCELATTGEHDSL